MFNIVAIGTIGKIEVKSLQSGMTIAEGSIASNRQVKGEKFTDWLNFKAFGKTAEVVGDFVKKGDQAIFSGSLQTESWEKDGQKQSKTVMIIERFEFGKNKRETEQATSSPQFSQGFTQKEQKSAWSPNAVDMNQPFQAGAFDDTEVPF
jgi:single-strand DNA-binding protein